MDKLEKRKEIKKAKPEFRRQDSHKKLRVSRTGYRKPKGIQSKVRLNKKGYVKKVKTGYGSPVDVKGMHPSGYVPFLVENVSQLDTMDPKKEGVIVSSNVGERKRVSILSKSKELGIKVLNIKDVDARISDADKFMKAKKEDRNKIMQKRSEKEKSDKEKKKEEKESKKSEKSETEGNEGSETDSQEEKKDQQQKSEKSEKDKVLTKKEN